MTETFFMYYGVMMFGAFLGILLVETAFTVRKWVTRKKPEGNVTV